MEYNYTLKESFTNETSSDLIFYCASDGCKGVPLSIDYKNIEGGLECPVCYDSLDSGKVTTLLNCSHIFCAECIIDWKHEKGCPMCRGFIAELVTLNKPVVCSIENLKILYNEHQMCEFNSLDYVADLNDVWRKFILFILNTHTLKPKYIGIRGIEHMQLDKYKNEGRLLKKGPRHAIIKKKNGSTKVFVSCYLPCMSIRLVISPNDDTDIGQDDEYADEAVGYMNKQLEVCWKVFARLFKKGPIDFMFIRKFEKVTCYLLLTGFHDIYVGHHFSPMKEQLRSLKENNFNASLFDSLRKKLPALELRKCTTRHTYNENDCCKTVAEVGEDAGE